MIQEIPLEKLVIADYNPREARDPEIIQGIIETYKQHGLLEPLLVREREDGMYEVINGGTRLEALQALGAKTARCIIYKCSRKEAMKIAATSHFVREDLTPAEKGKYILRCLKEGVWKTIEQAAQELGLSRETIYNYIREAKALEPEVREIPKPLKEIVVTLPKPVRKEIVEEVKKMPERELPIAAKVLQEIREELREAEPKQAVSLFVEKLGEKIKEIERPRKIAARIHEYELMPEAGALTILQYHRGAEAGRLKIPLEDLRVLVRALNAYLEEL